MVKTTKQLSLDTEVVEKCEKLFSSRGQTFSGVVQMLLSQYVDKGVIF